MLKSNSSNGKLEILITDESLFGTGKKGTVKPCKSRGITKQSHFQGKQQTKPVTDKVLRGRDIKQPKPVKREAKTRKEKTARSHSVSKIKPHDTGVISKTHLDNILLLLNTEGSNAKEFSSAQLESQLTSLGKNRTIDFEGNEEVCVKPDDYIVDAEGKKARTNAVLPRKKEKKYQENENQISNTVQFDTESKRMQWKRELDEQVLFKMKVKEEEKQAIKNKDIEEYNPWGRPGGGAPIRSQSGKVLANYQNRPAVSKNEIPKDENNAAPLVSSCHASSTVSQSRSSPVSKLASNTRDVNTILPVAMRSCFAIGAPGLVAHDTQHKRLQEIQWKQELQKQIEEKKERERRRKLKEAQEDFLNLSWNAKQNLNAVSPPQRTTDMKNQVRESYGKNPGEDILLQSTQDHSTPVHPASLNSGSETHARGFGMRLMDPQAKEEATKKRLKMLEHQLAIQEQVEEKRRIKQWEREQRLRDDAIEEARLAKERENFNKVFVMEQKQKREKEEEAKRISEALQQSVLDAYQASQRAKADKRRRHLGATGQDIRTDATICRSYVLSQTTSEAQQIATDSMRGSPGDNSVTACKPQVSGIKSPRTNKMSIGTSSQTHTVYFANPSYRKADTVVPPLDLADRNSPPVPTLRIKRSEKYVLTSPKSSSKVSSEVATNRSLLRNVSSHSEPCDASLALSFSKRGTNGSVAGGAVSQCDNLPFSAIEDAFMVPFHRSDSATLPAPPAPPAPPETSEPITSHGVTIISPRAKKGKGINTQKHFKDLSQNNGKTVMPYRTVHYHLKPEVIKPEGSTRRAKGNKRIKERYQSQSTKATPSPRSCSKESDQEKFNTQQRHGKTLGKKPLKEHVAPKNDASCVFSAQQVLSVPLQTARQELILQQLAALRQGLALKERELKQDTM